MAVSAFHLKSVHTLLVFANNRARIQQATAGTEDSASVASFDLVRQLVRLYEQRQMSTRSHAFCVEKQEVHRSVWSEVSAVQTVLDARNLIKKVVQIQ